MASDVSMCHTQQFCGWDIYKRLRLPGTIHVVGLPPGNHTISRLAYSRQTPMGSVDTIQKNCYRKPGHHNVRISTQTMRNDLRRLTLRARQPYWGPILNMQQRAARLNWVTVQRLSFLNLPHTGLPQIKCSPYTTLASLLIVLYPIEHRRRTSLIAR